ncbi:site-specific integrase [Acidobacteria bacterium AH-259-O06]|nr:site-specific integrase [Acidobacteria bacterium AH-259-G07]MDA2931114.1 site-specific integrase [Acidobacteria bacterium AH-259-O06]
MKAPLPNLLALTLRAFLSDHLPRLRGMSPHTIHSYRDCLVLLLRFLASHWGREPAELDLEDIGPDAVVSFLNHLETERHNTVSTRNVRLAAIHAFFRYVAAQRPDRLDHCQSILAIPFKRARAHTVEYLEFDEIQAVLSAIDRTTPDGRRDYALMATMFNTGARVQEILDLRAYDLQLTKPFQVRLFGKGRKERLCPLWPQTAKVLRAFCAEQELDLRSVSPLFLNHNGQPLTRFGVRYILAKYLQFARRCTPSLANKRLHPHSMRHSTAVHLLKAGVDLTTISHWLGHASINTTNKYAAIDLEMKRQALARAMPLEEQTDVLDSWRSDATIMQWLEAL